MESLADCNTVHALVGQWDVLGSAAQRFDVWKCVLELGPHRLARLDRDHASACFDQRARQFSGSGAEVEDRARAPEADLAGDPIDRLLRIARTRTLVQVGDELEAARVGMLELRHAKTGRGR